MQRHDEAAEAFIKTYGINNEDYGAQYRAFRSLALADDVSGFRTFLTKEIVDFPEIAELLDEDVIFKKMLSFAEIQEVIDNAAKG